jgi:hypothetical protein
MVIHEVIFESLAEKRAYFEEVYALPGIQEAIGKLGAFTEGKGGTEEWYTEVLT